MKNFLVSFKKRLKDTASDDEGSITVEFIVMLPLLAFWFIGAITFFEAYRSNSLTAKVAYTISDIASKYGEGEIPSEQGMYVSDLEELYQLQQRMLPRRVGRGSMRISSICFFADPDQLGTVDTDAKLSGTYRVLWSWVKNDASSATPLVKHVDATVPLDIMPKMAGQDTIILVELYTEWTPISNLGGIFSPLSWRNHIAERPRILPTGVPLLPAFPNTVCNETGPIGAS